MEDKEATKMLNGLFRGFSRGGGEGVGGGVLGPLQTKVWVGENIPQKR